MLEITETDKYSQHQLDSRKRLVHKEGIMVWMLSGDNRLLPP